MLEMEIQIVTFRIPDDIVHIRVHTEPLPVDDGVRHKTADHACLYHKSS